MKTTLLTIATVIKPPAPGFEKTRESVVREFGDADDVEWLVKIKEGRLKIEEDKFEIKDGKFKMEEREETGSSNFQSSIFNLQSSIFNYQFSLREIRADDTGVFDGMNQAVEAARGEWILFLNAGDWLAVGVGKVLREAIHAYPKADFLYFDGITVDAVDGREFPRPAPDSLTLRDFLRRAPILHPCLVVKRELLKRLPFDSRLDLAADFDLMLKLVSGGKTGQRLPRPGAYVVSGGLSEQYRVRARRQAIGSLWKHAPGLGFRISVLWSFLRFLVLHFVIVYLIRPIPFLRKSAQAVRKGLKKK